LNYHTKEQREELLTRLADLKKKKNEISGKIAEAAAQGDLKENAEYHAARESMAYCLRQISELNETLNTHQVYDKLPEFDGTIRIGTIVKLKWNNDDEEEFEIVGKVTPSFKPNAIDQLSVDSPIGKLILGKREGDSVEHVPNVIKIVSVKTAF
jgi:transcription elongation factor GreA